jgi:DNA-binding beta-propeller fold protein YncE
VYVVDSISGGTSTRIQRFSAMGQFLDTWGGPGRDPDVAVAPDGTVYVAGYWDSHPKPYGGYQIHLIERYSATGQFLGRWGSGGSEDGQFDVPSGVAVTLDGTVYVADADNYRVQAFGPTYPTTWRGEFFANRWLAERPLAITQTVQVAFDWGSGAPDLALPADGFSARFQRYVWFEAGFYRFTLDVDEGARLWVDEQLLVDRWEGPFGGLRTMPAGTYSAPLFLATGDHRVRLEYNDLSGPAAVHLSWELLAPAHRVYLSLVTKGLVLSLTKGY